MFYMKRFFPIGNNKLFLIASILFFICHGSVGASSNSSFHIGVLISKILFPDIYYAEFTSVIRLAVQLVNNKSDGWFDEELSGMNLVYRVDDPQCDFDVAQEAAKNQSEWAMQLGAPLDGILGADCSAAR